MSDRIWRTDDGRHVPDGHPDAAFLAYGPGDPAPKSVLDEIGAKEAPVVEDKEDSSAEDKSGLKVDTRASVIRELEDLGQKVDRRKSTETLIGERDEAKAAGNDEEE